VRAGAGGTGAVLRGAAEPMLGASGMAGPDEATAAEVPDEMLAATAAAAAGISDCRRAMVSICCFSI